MGWVCEVSPRSSWEKKESGDILTQLPWSQASRQRSPLEASVWEEPSGCPKSAGSSEFLVNTRPTTKCLGRSDHCVPSERNLRSLRVRLPAYPPVTKKHFADQRGKRQGGSGDSAWCRCGKRIMFGGCCHHCHRHNSHIECLLCSFIHSKIFAGCLPCAKPSLIIREGPLEGK